MKELKEFLSLNPKNREIVFGWCYHKFGTNKGLPFPLCRVFELRSMGGHDSDHDVFLVEFDEEIHYDWFMLNWGRHRF